MKFELYHPLAIHEIGKRDNQEDSIYPLLGEATEQDRLFIVCDGMGGHEHGEVASQTFSQGLAEYFEKVSADNVLDDETLKEAIEYAYRKRRLSAVRIRSTSASSSNGKPMLQDYAPGLCRDIYFNF